MATFDASYSNMNSDRSFKPELLGKLESIFASNHWTINSISYYFRNSNNPPDTFYYTDDKSPNSFEQLPQIDREYFSEIFSYCSKLFKLNFIESNTQSGNISIGSFHFTMGGYASYPNDNLADIEINNDYTTGWSSTSNIPGGFTYGAIVHELGHALGLPHTNTGSSILSNYHESAMGYINDGKEQTSFGAYDILALQQQYGSVSDDSNDTYFLRQSNPGTTNKIFDGSIINLLGDFCLYDGGGKNTINLSLNTSPSVLDINENHYSWIGKANSISSGFKSANLSIAFNSKFYNVIGSNYGDTIYGNNLNNNISCGNGNDFVWGNGGDDIIDGNQNSNSWISGVSYSLNGSENIYFYNNHFYKIYDLGQHVVTWNEANTISQNQSLFGISGNLVSITSQSEQDFITGILTNSKYSSSYEVYIGLTKTNESWNWTTNEVLDYTNWESSQPSNSYTGNSSESAVILDNDWLPTGEKNKWYTVNDDFNNHTRSNTLAIVEFDTTNLPPPPSVQNVAEYNGNLKDYSLNISMNNIIIEDKISSRDGTDTLLNIQKLQFSDTSIDTSMFTKTVSLSHSSIVNLVELYIASFNRAPDSVGLNYWGSRYYDGLNNIANGMSLEQIAKSFFVQPETVAAYPTTMATKDFVTTVYNNVLSRAPDAGGLNYWVGELNNGNVSKDSFLLAIINGAKAITGGAEDRQTLANKTDVGMYYALEQGLNNSTIWAKDVMSDVDADTVSVTEANTKTDHYAAIAADPASSDLVVKLVGALFET